MAVFEKTVAYNNRSVTKPPGLMVYIWDSIMQNMRCSLTFADNADVFFETADYLFRSLDKSILQDLDLEEHARLWSELLLQHDHVEVGD